MQLVVDKMGCIGVVGIGVEVVDGGLELLFDSCKGGEG